MLGTILLDPNTKQILNELSEYKPSEEILSFTIQVKEDYHTGYTIQNNPYEEFNYRSVLQVMEDDQKRFNTYIEPASADPDEAWRYFGVRPITRNKIISIVAHLTMAILYPKAFPQDQMGNTSKEAAATMNDLIQYEIRNSNYEEAFLFAVVSMCVNPAAILQAEYAEVFQDIRIQLENGEIDYKQAVDEVLSGFHTLLVPVDELLIANIREFYLQKQRFLIRRRFADYDEMQALFGEHENFKYVDPHTRVFYDEERKGFYKQVDEEMPSACEHVRYYNRRLDLEVDFVNGVYMGKPVVRDNTMKHRRMTVATDGSPVSVPVYPFSKSGGEPINDMRFFYYKSYAAKLGPDQDLVDRMWRMVVDGTFLEVMKPVITTGAGKIDQSVIFPGLTTNLPANATVTPLGGLSNPERGYNVIAKLEESMSQSSQDKLMEGSIDQNSSAATAYAAGQAVANAKINLGLITKMISFLVRDFGQLMVDCIIQHETVAQAVATIGEESRLTYKSFLLRDQYFNGRKVSKQIRFTDEMLGLDYTNEELKERRYELYDEGGGDEMHTLIVLVNPYLFSSYKYLAYVDADTMKDNSEAAQKAFNLEAYDRMIQNPLVDQRAVTQDFLVDTFAKGNSERYMLKNNNVMPLPEEESMEEEVEGGKKSSRSTVIPNRGRNAAPQMMGMR